MNVLFFAEIQKGYGHIFISDDDASSLLTLLERLRIEALLANNTMTENVTYSKDHLLKLVEGIDDISDSENEFDISSKQFDNSTVNALLFANLIDEVLTNYGASFGVSSSVMTNMSYLSPNLMEKANKSEAVIDNDSYLTSQEYAKRSWEIYNFNLRIFETNDSKNFIEKLGQTLTDLIHSIDNKTNPFKIMNIVHTEIHPNLQSAFNLTTLKP
ncbi:MAG: hypothetical protein DA329_09885 [Candidatus Nitrosocosmicus sp.]|nr:hypothetical protein [Candidatus Nitrosocosmicus sp.]